MIKLFILMKVFKGRVLLLQSVMALAANPEGIYVSARLQASLIMGRD
jgi:hypothetical protein